MRVLISRTSLQVMVCIWLSGCGASEEKVQDKFEEFLSSRRDCTGDDECTVGSFDCPLGCFQTYNEKYDDEVQDEAERLIKKYERGGRSCEYGCSEAAPAICNDGQCQFE